MKTGIINYTLPKQNNVDTSGIVNAEIRKNRNDRNFLKVFDLVSAKLDNVTSQALTNNTNYVSAMTGQIINGNTNKFTLPDWASRLAFKTSEIIRRNPILSRIAEPSKLNADIKRTYPKTYNQVSKMSTLGLGDSVVSIWNPILALAVPIKMPLKIPLRPLRKPEFFEFQTGKVIDGKTNVISNYKIIEEKTPPLILPSKSGGYLNPIIKEPTYQIIKNVNPIKNSNPILTLRTSGGHVGNLDIISGNSKPLSLAEFNKLPKQDKYILQKIAERKTGIAVSLKNVPKILSEGERTQGNILKYRIGKINIKNKELRLLEPKTLGKTTTQFKTINDFKQVAETKDYKMFTGYTYFKDVTKPFSRASGEVPRIKGTILIKKNMESTGGTDVRFLQPANIKKTPLSKTFQKSQDIFVSPKNIPKSIKKPIIKKTKSKLKENDKFRLSGGLLPGFYSVMGNQPLIFINDVNSGFVKSFIGQETTQKVEAGNGLGTSQNIKTNSLTKSGQTSSQKTPQREIFKVENKFKQEFYPSQKETTKTAPQFNQEFKYKQNYKLKLKSAEPEIKQNPRPKPNFNQNPKPKENKFKKPNLNPKKKTYLSHSKILELFKIYKKQKGKFYEFETAKTSEEAFAKLRNSLKSDTSASGYVKKGNKKIKAFEGISSNFRLGKNNPFLLVQKLGGRFGGRGRISTRAEKFSIQKAKDKKSKKIKWF